jgi:electron transfer flavoprotein beta subunit
MKIAVCLKLVPATTADIRVAPGGQSLQLAGVETVVSPYDEYALEAALKIREQFSGSNIVALTVGGDDALKCLQHAFSLGVDAGIHIKAPNADARAAAKLAAAALKARGVDVVLCGRQAIDDDQWQFPGSLGELLDMPHVSAVSALEFSPDGKSTKAKRRSEGGEQSIETFLPAVITCDKGLNEPRAPTLKGRLDAKKKQPEIKSAADLGLSDADLQPSLNITKYSPPAEKSSGKTLSGAPEEMAKELVRLLREEAKII